MKTFISWIIANFEGVIFCIIFFDNSYISI